MVLWLTEWSQKHINWDERWIWKALMTTNKENRNLSERFLSFAFFSPPLREISLFCLLLSTICLSIQCLSIFIKPLKLRENFFIKKTKQKYNNVNPPEKNKKNCCLKRANSSNPRSIVKRTKKWIKLKHFLRNMNWKLYEKKS